MVVICSADFLYFSGNILPNKVYSLLKLKALGNFLILSNPILLSVTFLVITDKLCLSSAPKHIYISFICLDYIFYLLAQILN